MGSGHTKSAYARSEHGGTLDAVFKIMGVQSVDIRIGTSKDDDVLNSIKI